jgi:TDG/mug DNA glycosylase family protein
MILPDYLSPGLRLVFCGTAAGHASAAAGHYYAKKGNRFWGLLAEAGLTPRRYAPSEDHLLPGLGIGLTDLAKEVSGMDHQIPPEAYSPSRLAEMVARFRPAALAFTSLTAARLALGDGRIAAGRLESSPWPGMAIFALPSPSGRNGHFSRDPWLDLGRWWQEGRR